MLHQVGVSFDLYYDARKHKIEIILWACIYRVKVSWLFNSWHTAPNVEGFLELVDDKASVPTRDKRLD